MPFHGEAIRLQGLSHRHSVAGVTRFNLRGDLLINILVNELVHHGLLLGLGDRVLEITKDQLPLDQLLQAVTPGGIQFLLKHRRLVAVLTVEQRFRWQRHHLHFGIRDDGIVHHRVDAVHQMRLGAQAWRRSQNSPGDQRDN